MNIVISNMNWEEFVTLVDIFFSQSYNEGGLNHFKGAECYVW